MNRPAILAVLLAAGTIGFAMPAFAEGDDNDPHMKLFQWDGRYYEETRPQHMDTPRQRRKNSRDGSGAPEMKGPEQMPPGPQNPGTN